MKKGKIENIGEKTMARTIFLGSLMARDSEAQWCAGTWLLLQLLPIHGNRFQATNMALQSWEGALTCTS